jgi:hypothetical protein
MLYNVGVVDLHTWMRWTGYTARVDLTSNTCGIMVQASKKRFETLRLLLEDVKLEYKSHVQ